MKYPPILLCSDANRKDKTVKLSWGLFESARFWRDWRYLRLRLETGRSSKKKQRPDWVEEVEREDLPLFGQKLGLEEYQEVEFAIPEKYWRDGLDLKLTLINREGKEYDEVIQILVDQRRNARRS